MRPSMLLVLVSAVLLACDQAATAPTDYPSNLSPSFRATTEHIPLEETFSFVTPNPCNGEDVAVTGRVTGLVNLTSDSVGFEQGQILHTEFHLLASGTGVGLTTGATYLYRDVMNQSFNSPSGAAPHASTDFEQTFRMISQGGEPNYRLVVGFHAVYLPPDAALSVRVDRVREVCQG
jgi:hypothetical protein